MELRDLIENREEITNFSYDIECMAKEHNISYIDAIIQYCEQTGLELELTPKLISGSLKAKIKIEAEQLNFLPKSNTMKLPMS